MALIQASVESGFGPSRVMDPFDWTPDQVVHCFCSPDSPLLGSNGRLRLPDPDGFASVLRDEGIDGEALLTLITKDMLHDTWGLKYGMCAKILNLIRKLQQQSSRYQELRKEIVVNDRSLLESTVQTSHRSTPYVRSPEHRDLNFQSPSLDMTCGYLQARNLHEQRPVFPQSSVTATDTHGMSGEIHPGTIVSAEPGLALHAGRAQKETTYIDDKGQKRRRLILAPAPVALASNQVDPIVQTQEGALQELINAEENGCSDPALEGRDQKHNSPSTGVDFPDLIQSSGHFNNDVASSRTVFDHITDEKVEAGGNQRRRIQPTPVVQPHDDLFQEETHTDALHTPESRPIASKQENDLVFKHSHLGKRAKRAIDQIYYGPSALDVDDLFYCHTALGAVLHDDIHNLTAEQQELCFNSLGQKSDAQRLWVNARMKFFFQSTTSDLLAREGGQEVGIIPYPDRLGKRNKPLSMTLLSNRGDGILTKRENRSDWTTTAFSSKLKMETNALDMFKVRDPFMAVDENSTDWDALLKWNHRDDHQILPLYGDSGSEGEYDLETWREIEAESGKIMRPERRSKRQNLSLDEVEVAIDIAIKQLRDEWHVKQQPRVRYKARQYWVKARRDHTTAVQIKTLEQRLKKLETRIMGLRKEICEEQWTKSDQILKQSKSMQPSVFEQEECQWKIGILKSKQAPEKMTGPCPKPRKDRVDTPPLQDGEEDLNSNASSVADEETEDDLNEFIVSNDDASDDDQIADWDEDTTMADVEDAIQSDTVLISPNDPLLPRVKKKNSSKIIPKLEGQSQSAPTTTSTFIDLTRGSSTPSSPSPKREPGRIVTPPIMNSEEDSEAWFQRSRGKKSTFKHPPTVDVTSVINLDTDSDSQIISKSRTELPSLNSVERIRALSPTKLVENQDRKRLLVWLIAHTHDDKCKRIVNCLESFEMEGCFAQVKAGLKKMKAEKLVLHGKNQETSDCILQIAAWYVGWTIPVKMDPQGVSISHIRTTLENDEGFEEFFAFMLECLKRYKQQSSPPNKRKARKPLAHRFGFELSESSSSASPRILASESQETLQKRDTALQRMREDNQRTQLRALRKARQIELLARVSNVSSLQAGQLEESEVILNPGKRDEQEFIRLNRTFGRGARLKSHQEDGLRFMWREIAGDHNDLQGCLLAQTMGLGKTVQVIALLVALSEAANSSNRAVCEQVPIQLHNSQTLILCPPGLIENWWDEFLLWPPEPNYLGEIRKVSTVMKLEERISDILEWSQEGGILLMGYSTFRDLLQNKPRTSKANKATATTMSYLLTGEQHQKIRFALLQKPNIVVADEAHEFKSQNSSINQVINQIACKSRIALTGSPLSNNLGEYFSMIDWIAPGYLGTYNDFKNVYESPIQNGLYQDQEPALYRESRKRLKALELELEPKIHRAEPSALHNSLNGKSEFVVRVPLTAFQERLYRKFVAIINGVNGSIDGKGREAKLWSYLSRLQLLCNHPLLFYNKLVEEQKDWETVSKPNLLRDKVPKQNRSEPDSKSESLPKNASKTDALIGEDPEPLPESVLSIAIRETRQDISELGEAVNTPRLSNKMQALMKIIELSKSAEDKVLVFSHRLDTLDYIGTQLKDMRRTFCRIDGMTLPQRRQEITKSFNEGTDAICLISTKAGGQGLNMFGANRVVILDSLFNPMWEQQAVGRAYRIGQQKHVYVYRLTVAGTFEEEMQDQALFKEQLATRVLEKKNPNRIGLSGAKQYIFPPKQVKNGDIMKYLGKDTGVLDHLLMDQERTPIVSITPSETFYLDDGNDLTAQERKEAEQLLKDEQLRRRNPAQYQVMLQQRYRLPLHSTASLSLPIHQPVTFGVPSSRDLPSATAPAQDLKTHVANRGLVVALTALFPSGLPSLTKRVRARKPLRLEAKSNILNLVSRKHVPHPKNTAGRLRIMIDQNAKDEEDYLRLWRGIRTLLEMPDVHPDALLNAMIAELGEQRQGELEIRRTRSDSLSTEATSSLQAEGTANLGPIEGNPRGSAQSAVDLKAPPGSPFLLMVNSPSPSQTGNLKRSQIETEMGPPLKKQKPASIDT